MCLLVSSHPCILISSGSCVLACILTSSHPQVHVYLLVYLHPDILISSGSCALVGILASSYSRILRFMCAGSHPQINVFSIRMNNCILASSSPLVLVNYASQFVNNLQILQSGQASVLDFYRTSRKTYRK